MRSEVKSLNDAITNDNKSRYKYFRYRYKYYYLLNLVLLMKQIKLKSTVIAILVGIALSQTSCVALLWKNCIEVGGKVTTESRKTNTFKSIELNIPANVYVSQGSPQEVKITAKRGVIDQILAEVEENTLSFDYDTCVSNADSIKIYITAKDIYTLQINGSGNISTLYPIKSDDLVLEINGSGDIKVDVNATKITNQINGSGKIKLSGSSETLEIEINGSGDVHALDAPTDDCFISVNGSGDCDVFVKKLLEIKVNGSGDVEYKGSPEISTSIIGSGSVKSIASRTN